MEKLKLRSLLTEALHPIIAYHGSTNKITNFVMDFVGGKEAHDQEGPGIYFTTSEEDAGLYGTIIHKVELSLRKTLTTSPNILKHKNTLLKLIQQAPNYLDTLQNFDENPRKALSIALEGTIDYNDTEKDAFQQVWVDFYRNRPIEYVKNCVAMGIDGLIVPMKEGVQHIIIYNPTSIKLIS